MTTKLPKAKTARYTPEDLAPRDVAADEALLESYLERNKDALNSSIEKAHAEFERGEYFTLDQVMADVRVQQQRRTSRKA